MLEPKKLKFRKPHRPKNTHQTAVRLNSLAFGEFGLKAITGNWISARQIESARKAITHHIKRGGKVWIRIFPHRPITGKGGEVGMGHGKGIPEYYIAEVKAGMLLFEIQGVPEELAREAMTRAAHKLPVKTKFVKE